MTAPLKSPFDKHWDLREILPCVHTQGIQWDGLGDTSAPVGLLLHTPQLLLQCCRYKKCFINIWLTDLIRCLDSYAAQSYFNPLVSKLVFTFMAEKEMTTCLNRSQGTAAFVTPRGPSPPFCLLLLTIFQSRFPLLEARDAGGNACVVLVIVPGNS